jgi:large conductance mechanosensitive channel
MLTSGVDFAKLAIVLKPDNPATAANELVAIQYGALINAGIKFLIVAWVVFLIVKAVNALRRKEAAAPEAPPAPTPQEALLIEIRDLLKSRA